jgi:hypothetical protein
MSRNELIRRCLRSGPCASREVAKLTGLSFEEARVGIMTLRQIRHVEFTGRTRPCAEFNDWPMRVYDLTVLGRLRRMGAARETPPNAKRVYGDPMEASA